MEIFGSNDQEKGLHRPGTEIRWMLSVSRGVHHPPSKSPHIPTDHP
jgi:hypothetical protein